ncbi:MAG: bifunctional diaminohydroxyphosphoribosylaminopyrimidine deaminase/5-amino-6-(5-phosphoribosylamino)uracil reductase RibD [Tepidisphaeraceae bacterium]
MISAFDEQMLRRALRVAMNGRGRVEPNPMVGCVLVKNEQIIAEGWHTHFGGPHAEPTALADCQARGNDPRGTTAYVTLEPCCHTNKKTPPCAPRLIEAGISRVVIGCLDPNPDVDGKGVAMLRYAGIEVDAAPPELAAEFLQLIAPFRSPPFYTTLKWAESSDGRVAGAGGMPIRITGPQADLAVHRLRTRSDAIAVGRGTATADDPALTIRGVDVLRKPTRIVIGFGLTPTSKMVTTASPNLTAQPLVMLAKSETLASEQLGAGPTSVAEQLERLGVKIIAVTGDDLRADLQAAAVVPVSGHLMIEPGPRLAAAALPWADRLWVFRSRQVHVNSPAAPRAATIPASYLEAGRIDLGPDVLIEYFNRNAASFVTATPSADFVLEAERAASV